MTTGREDAEEGLGGSDGVDGSTAAWLRIINRPEPEHSQTEGGYTS